MPTTTRTSDSILATTTRGIVTTTLDKLKERVVYPLVARLYKPEPPNATILLKNGARIRAFMSGHGTDVVSGEGETFYVAADEQEFDVRTGVARESRVSDDQIERIDFDEAR